MSDPGNAENPPEQKPFTPDPKKSIFDRPPAQSRITEPDPDYHATKGDPPNLGEPISQEEAFRFAAIKCAELQDEIAVILHSKPFPIKGFHASSGFGSSAPREGLSINYSPDGRIDVYSRIEHLKGVDAGQLEGAIPIRFKDGVANFADKAGVETTRELEVRCHTDEDTRREYESFAKSNPIDASNAITYYYFNARGEYGKISDNPTGIPTPSNTTTFDKNDHHSLYKSRMTEGDFELAGQVLSMTKKRLLNPNWDTEPQTDSTS